MTPKNSCYGCEKRQLGCHSKCEKYKKWLKDFRKDKENIRKREQRYRDYFYR